MRVKSIFGPPGTGKTQKLVDLIRNDAGPKKLFLSYTRAAAAEALGRVAHGVHVSTMHALAYKALGLTRASVVDRYKLVQFSKATGIPFRGTETEINYEMQEGDEYLQVLSYMRNTGVGQEAYDMFGRPGTVARWRMFNEAYRGWKDAYGYMDFEDMLEKFVGCGMPEGRYDAIFLDEAQDCTPLQWTAFEHLCRITSPEHVYIAGDDDQAIYEWNGADPHGMVKFTEKHGGEASVLGNSHRVPVRIADLATGVIGQVDARVDKVWVPAGREGTVERWNNVELWLSKHSHDYKSVLVLVRDNFALMELKRIMNRDMIPYDVFGGSSPWTGKVANYFRKTGKLPPMSEIPVQWREFYAQADLTQPVRYHLSTIHGAKGRESDVVVMDLTLTPRVLLGLQSNRNAEVRVQYVGMTRTRNRLILCGWNPIVPC